MIILGPQWPSLHVRDVNARRGNPRSPELPPTLGSMLLKQRYHYEGSWSLVTPLNPQPWLRGFSNIGGNILRMESSEDLLKENDF